MKRIEITPNGEVWLEQRADWVLSTPWDTVPIYDLDDLPKLAEALHYALARYEGERHMVDVRGPDVYDVDDEGDEA